MPQIPAARTTMAVLRYLAGRSGPVRASTLARDLGLPRSSAYQLLGVMLDEGFLVHYPEHHAYGLSTLVSEIGSSALRTARLAQLAQPLMERLIGTVSLPAVAHLAVLSGSDVMYAARVQGFRAPTTVSGIGVRLPAHLTATGRAMLARLPQSQLRALYAHSSDLATRNGSGLRTLAELDRVLELGRERGWSREDGDIQSDYSSVAASALDHNDYPVAAIGLTFRATAVDRTDWVPLGEAVTTAANALTARLRGQR
jgi:DNA-binding IclR family transcriptional regulator